MKMRAKGLRRGFVLPMALVLTGITLSVIGVSAYYCTTAMATSNEYLSRTRCRLAAQSAIEQTKIVIQRECAGLATKIADAGSANFGKSLGEAVEAVKDSEELAEFLADMRWDEAHRAESDTTVWIDITFDEVKQVNNIYATAEVRKGNRTTTVTLQEGIAIPVSDASIFQFLYFANGDGHLVSKDMTVNGDVYANGDFYLSGVNVNGFIYATNKVYLAASSAKNWWDGRYVTSRTAASYNAKFRSGKYSKARPTDPLKKDVPWENGFREPEDLNKRKSLLEILRDIVDFLLRRDMYDDGEVPLSDSVAKTLETASAPKEKIVRQGKEAPQIPFPRIVSDSEPETDSDAHLDYYKDYARQAKTPKGKTGGSLVCSNSYMTAAGTNAQLSARVLLSWTDGNPSSWDLSEGTEDRSKLPDGVDPSKSFDPEYNTEYVAETDRDKASLLFPKGSIPVYNCIPAAIYDALPSDKKASWRMLSGNRPTSGTVVGDGLVGSFDGGFANFDEDSLQGMYNDSSIFSDGKGLFFTQSALGGALVELSALDGEASEMARTKFNDGSWKPCEATYDTSVVARGSKVIDTQFVEVYSYTASGPSSLLDIIPFLALYTSVDDGYLDPSGEGYVSDDLDEIASDFSVYDGVSFGDVTLGFASVRKGYRLRSYSGYWGFQLVKNYEGDAATYEVKRQRVTRKDEMVNSDWEKRSDVHHYTGNYYSSQPAGYLGITVTTNWVEQSLVKDVKFEYTPFVPETRYEPVPARTNLVDVQFMTLYPCVTKNPYDTRNYKQVGSSGAIQSGYNHNGTSVPMSGFANRLFNETELTPITEKFAADYDLDPSEVTELFGNFDGWSHFAKSGRTNPSIWYKPSDTSAGFVAVRLYEVTKGSEHLDYFVDYVHATATEKSALEKARQAAQASDVVETLYIPLHEYKANPTSAEKASGKWVTLSYWVSGYQDTSTAKNYKGRFIPKSDIAEIGEILDDKYDVGEDALLNNFTTKNGWTSRTSGWYNTDPSGYFRITVIKRTISRPYPSTTYSLNYSYVANWSGAVDENPTEIPNEVPDGCIPVYKLSATESSWKSVSTVSGGGYKNASATQFIKASELDDVVDDFTSAAAADGSHRNLTAEAVREEVMAYFAAAGWKSAGTSGRYKENPVGYLTLSADYDDDNRFRQIGVDFHVLSVDAGEVGYKPGEKVIREKTVDPDYYKNNPEEWWKGVDDGTIPWTPTVTVHTREPVTRQLRGIFVRDGHKLVSDNTFSMPGTGRTLTVPPEDLVLAGNRTVKSGDTTAELYPFREDAVCGCNRRNEGPSKSPAPDKGAVILIGTWDSPIMIDGPVVFESDVMIRGFVTGRGTIYSGRNIHIIGDICYKNPPFWPYGDGTLPDTKGKDLLMLVSRGSIVLGNYVQTGGKFVDQTWSKLLSGHYIDGRANSNDALSRGVPYVKKDYTQDDTTGGTNYKIDYRNYRFGTEKVKYYESVIGDYVFLSRNNSSGNRVRPDPNAVNVEPYCDCRFAQTWDFNFGAVGSVLNTGYEQYACSAASVIENYVNSKNWTTQDRVGVIGGEPGKSFAKDLWDTDQTAFLNYVNNTYASGRDFALVDILDSIFGTLTKPRLDCIQAINAVMYSSEGLYGSMGAHKTSCVVNGAIYCQEEALLPFTRMLKTLFSSKSDDLKVTLNWDIRLNTQSGDSKNNGEDGEEFGGHMKSKNENANMPGAPIPISWQEVPDDFNKDYRGD